MGKIQLKEAYAEVSSGEAWLVNAHISEYSHGNIMNHPPVRKRKLLLHKAEIEKLQTETREKGLTLVPTKLYLKTGRIKIEIAVGKGKEVPRQARIGARQGNAGRGQGGNGEKEQAVEN